MQRIPWPYLMDIAATGLPFVVAWAAGRLSWRDPAGRLGIAWGALFLCTVVQLVGSVVRRTDLMLVGHGVGLLVVPLLFTPALLVWAGQTLARRTVAITAALTLWGVGALLAVGNSRAVTMVYAVPLHLVLLAFAVAMLGAQARRASDPFQRPEPGWVWIAGGHVLYFLTFTVGRPLVEFLVPNGMAATVDAHMATMFLYTIALSAIAWGIWQGRGVRVAVPSAA